MNNLDYIILRLWRNKLITPEQTILIYDGIRPIPYPTVENMAKFNNKYPKYLYIPLNS